MNYAKSLMDFPTVRSYLNRVNAEERSLLKAVVKEQIGSYWNDLSIIKFDRQGNVAYDNDIYKPTDAEAEKIREEMSSANWPEPTFITMDDPNMPAMVHEADPEDVFEFKDINGNILMLQVRKQRKGEKSYIPVTRFSDGEFRFVEIDPLPLYGLDQLKKYQTVIISEGAKAARAGRRIAEGHVPDHPWVEELSNAAHIGFIGGALSPERSDWDALQKYGVTRAYISADNDSSGLSAVPKIAKRLNCPTFLIQYTDDFPVAFDLADPFPKHMFSKIGEKSYYCGPSFRQCLHPATYMTRMITVMGTNGKPKEIPVLRNHAKGQWLFAEETSLFVNAEMPDIVRSADVLDSMLAPFSDTKKTSELILQTFVGRTPQFAYKPGEKGRRIINNGVTAINLYIPSDVKPQAGDPGPWLEYLSYLIPDEKECYELQKWCATLIARPDVRQTWATLLISEQTGTGKTTLGNILSKLVGEHNTSMPTEQTIMETFNGWLAKKRLVVCSEIYQGKSFKTANKLKSYITEDTIPMRLMYRDAVDIDNYAHFLCCSNSLEALMVDANDRRWFIPTVTEERRSLEEWDKLFDWLKAGGYSIIADWAMKFGDYNRKGERAPMTGRKGNIIMESRSFAEREVIELTETLQSDEIAFTMTELFSWATAKIRGQVYDKPLQIQKAAKINGFITWNGEDRIYHFGRLQPVLLSPKLHARVQSMSRDEARAYVKSKIVLPSEAINQEIM